MLVGVVAGGSFLVDVSASKAGGAGPVEPVTSRPTANRFDFTNPAYSTAVSKQFALPDSLPETVVAAPTDRGNVLTPSPVATPRVVDRETSGARVAGWQRLRRIATDQSSASVVAVRVPPAPTVDARELSSSERAITRTNDDSAAPQNSASQRKKSVRRSAPAAKKNKIKKSSQRGWDAQALFPED